METCTPFLLMQVGRVSVENLIAFGVIVIILQRGKIRIVNIRQPGTAHATILILVAVFRFTLGTQLKATQGVQFKTHLLDAAAASVNILAQRTENLRIFFRIFIILFADICKNLNNPFFLIQNLSAQIIHLRIILHLTGNTLAGVSNLV